MNSLTLLRKGVRLLGNTTATGHLLVISPSWASCQTTDWCKSSKVSPEKDEASQDGALVTIEMIEILL